MNLQSVKARFMGSYLFLVVLFVIQVPIIYLLVGGMSAKYAQVEEAGSLRKRAIEITEILNRHIMTGDDALDKLFHTRKDEYPKVIEGLKKGTKDVAAITDRDILSTIDIVEQKWNKMDGMLGKAMESGDLLRKSKAAVEESTNPMTERINELIASIENLRDPAYVQYINRSGFLRARSMKLSYLTERYLTSYDDRGAVADDIRKTVAEFDEILKDIKGASASAARKGAAGEKFAAAAGAVEKLWEPRKASILMCLDSINTYHERLGELIDKNTPELMAASNSTTRGIADKARGAAMRGILLMAVSVFISACIAGIFMWATNSQVIRPMVRIKETVEDFASGDLTKRADVKVRLLGREMNDEITALGNSVDAMAEQMSEVIGKITDSSNHLASASEQLSTSSTQITEGADRQSSQTAHVATAMEEMSATVIEVAKNSQQASESARNAQQIATKGGDVVAEAIAAMQEVADSTTVTGDTIKKLGKSSEQIGTIISVINDIADQTNLLALNAAIEAARAGEQGRGFAVVADEVRKLAERTTKATMEIGDMIKSIQDETTKAVTAMDEGTLRVERGVKLANEAGDSLKQIVSGVENVTDMIGHIATSAEEQSATTEEITQNMDSIAEVAKTNVSAIGEVSKATNEMASLATELKSLVSKFKITNREYGAELSAARQPKQVVARERKQEVPLQLAKSAKVRKLEPKAS